MPCWGKKSIKINQKSIKKQLSNQHPNLIRFWTQLGLILEGFWGPRWGQVRSKSLQKSIFKSMIKKIAFQTALGTDFGGFGAKFGSQNGPPNPLSWSQDRPQTPKLGAKMGQGPPTCSQDGTKSCQSRPRTASWPDFQRFWTSIWQIFNRFWKILQPIRLHFGTDFASMLHALLSLKLAHRSYSSLPI